MQWVTLAVALGCVSLSRASHTPTPTPTSTHTPLVDNSEEEVDEPCFEPCTCEVKEGVLHVHCDGRSFTNVSQVPPLLIYLALHVELHRTSLPYSSTTKRICESNILPLMWLTGVSNC